MVKLCLICNSQPTDRCHIKTRGSGGTDDDWNIMHLCRRHHTEQHKIGIITFIEKHPVVKAHLENKGWQIIDLFGKKRLTQKD